jgi:hypothetical protein
MNTLSWASALNASPRLWAQGLGEGASVLTVGMTKTLEGVKEQFRSAQELNATNAQRDRQVLAAAEISFARKWEGSLSDQFIIALFSFLKQRHLHLADLARAATELAELCVQTVLGDEGVGLTDRKNATELAKTMFMADSLFVEVGVSRVDKSEFCRHVGLAFNVIEAPELEPSQVAIRFDNQSLILDEERAVDLWKQSEST